MSNIQNTISVFILTVLVVLGFMALGSGQAEAQDCSVSITKRALPANDTLFDFSVTGDQSFGFVLADPSDNQVGFGMSVGQTVTVTEITNQGWTLESIECVEGVTNCGMDGFEPCLSATVDGNSVTFECLDNDTASCVFTNVIATSSIPTLSEWGLIAMAAVIGAAGILMAIRRRKATA